MKLNKEAIELIKKFEGCKLNAYKDSVGIPTIGYGNTYYENGVKVKMGDVITIQRAEELLKNTLDKFSANVEKLIKTTATENQFGALVSLAYNIGIGNLTNSTLLKKVNANATASVGQASWKRCRTPPIRAYHRDCQLNRNRS